MSEAAQRRVEVETPVRAAGKRPYAAPALRSHGSLRELIREGNTLPAPDPFTGLTNQAT